MADRLVSHGVLEQARDDGYGPLRCRETARYILLDGSARQATMEHLRAIVLHSVEPDVSDVLLVSLLRACDLLDTLFSSSELTQARLRLRDLTEGEPVGTAVRTGGW